MTVRFNPSLAPFQKIVVPEQQSEVDRAATKPSAKAGLDSFQPAADVASFLHLGKSQPSNVAAAGAAQVSSAPAYDPAGDLFPALDWLDPATYQPADPSKLPAEQSSEVQHVLDAQASRTPEQTAIALDLAQQGLFSLWMNYADQYAQSHGPFAGAILKAKLALALGVDGAADLVEKGVVNEPRPYEVDPRITRLGGDPGGSSYPSGHAASAYAAATVLAEAMPDRANEFYAAAANVARSRVYLGVHFPGDVAAGARMGLSIGDDF